MIFLELFRFLRGFRKMSPDSKTAMFLAFLLIVALVALLFLLAAQQA